MAIAQFDELFEDYARSAVTQGDTLIAAAAALRQEAWFDIDLVVHIDTNAQAMVDVANEALASYALELYAAPEEDLAATLKPAKIDRPLSTVRRENAEIGYEPPRVSGTFRAHSDCDPPRTLDDPRLIGRIGTRITGALIRTELCRDPG